MNNIEIDPDLLEMAKEENLEDKAKAFDLLVIVGYIKLDDYHKTIIVRHGFDRVEIPISNYQYEILKRAMDI